MSGLEELSGKIQRSLPDIGERLPSGTLQRMLLPARRENFLYGRTPIKLREWVELKCGKRVAEKLSRKLRPWVTDFFFGVWCQYNKKMVEGEHEFASRIQKRYGISTADLKRHGKGARPITSGGGRTSTGESEGFNPEERENAGGAGEGNREMSTEGGVTNRNSERYWGSGE